MKSPIIVFLCWFASLVLQRIFMFKNNLYDNTNPKQNQSQLSGYGLRANNTMGHIQEQAPLFLIPLSILSTKMDVSKIDNWYCISRIIHTISYIFKLNNLRVFSFFIQLGCIFMVSYKCIKL